MIAIRKRPAPEGTYYEVVDFAAYMNELKSHGIDAPSRRYRVFVSSENAASLRVAVGDDWEEQIALLFRLSKASGIQYRFDEIA